MTKRPSILARVSGVAIGLIGAAVIIALAGGRANRAPSHGRIISECDGRLVELVIQYSRGSDAVVPVYRDFLRQLDADVTVRVMCPDRAAFDELMSQVPAARCSIVPHFTGHEMTAWSRDRWFACANEGSDRVTLVRPYEELGGESWPARKGDERLIDDLAAGSGGAIVARRSALYFDAGDFLANGNRVFVTPAVLSANLQRTVATLDELAQFLRDELGKEIVLLDDAPPHHAGMFMMPAGDGVMVVADPGLSSSHEIPEMPGGVDRSPTTQRQFDAVAHQVESLGYKVVRIPTAVANDGKSYLTYVNVITDKRDGRRIVYLPFYRRAETLNREAADVWRSLGYEVRPVDCTSTYTFFGNLHCLVNVLRRFAI